MGRSVYGRLSIAAKQQRSLSAMHEPAVSCPGCETQTTPGDLLQHLERCSGHGAPHPRSRWIIRREMAEWGVAPRTLGRWVSRGFVRAEGPKRHRRYLLRDVAQQVAIRRAGRGGR